MKNIKEITICLFAVIGFISIITGFTSEKTHNSSQYSIPESHVWSIQMSTDGANRVYSINAITGEVREINKANYKTLKKGN
tara:strand:+ start:1080 stop:1322 length:243 start_codon:yes stop_codon:yes gene_type:complete